MPSRTSLEFTDLETELKYWHSGPDSKSDILTEFKKIPFWRWELSHKEHHELSISTNGSCCFNHKLGLPRKSLLQPEMGMFEYEHEIYDMLQNRDRIWIKKGRGLGATEFMLRYMAWLCLRDDEMKGAQMAIIVGPNEDLGIDMITRFKEKIGLQKYFKFNTDKSIIVINGCVISAYASNHTDTLRSPEAMKFIFLDEADFFKATEVKKVIDASEGYTAKSRPTIVMVSTPAMPGGFYDQSENDAKFSYHKLIILFDRGMPILKIPNKYGTIDWYATINAVIAEYGWEKIHYMTMPEREALGEKLNSELMEDTTELTIYRIIDIVIAALKSSFPREYNGQYGHGEGDLFGPEIIDAISEIDYPMSMQDGQKVLAVDPSYGKTEGASKFGIVGFEQLDGIIYVRYAEQIARASPVWMTEKVAKVYHEQGYHICLVDGSQTGFIGDIESGIEKLGVEPVNVSGVLFKDNLTDMCHIVPRRCREKKVMISPKFPALINQLKACPTDEKGHPDKKKLKFDLGDCFLMGVSYYGEGEIMFDKI